MRTTIEAKAAGETPAEVTDRKGRRLLKKLDYGDGEVPPLDHCQPLEWPARGLPERDGRGRCLHPNCRRCWAEGVNRLFHGLRTRCDVAQKLGVPPPVVGFRRTVKLATRDGREVDPETYECEPDTFWLGGRRFGFESKLHRDHAPELMQHYAWDDPAKAAAEASSVAEVQFSCVPEESAAIKAHGTWMGQRLTPHAMEAYGATGFLLELWTYEVRVVERHPGEPAEGTSNDCTWKIWNSHTWDSWPFEPPGGMGGFFKPPPPILDPALRDAANEAVQPPDRDCRRATVRTWGCLHRNRVEKPDWGRLPKLTWRNPVRSEADEDSPLRDGGRRRGSGVEYRPTVF